MFIFISLITKSSNNIVITFIRLANSEIISQNQRLYILNATPQMSQFNSFQNLENSVWYYISLKVLNINH